MHASDTTRPHYATKGAYTQNIPDKKEPIFAAAKFTLTTKDVPKAGRKRREVTPPPPEDSNKEPGTIRHSKRLATKHMDFSVFNFDDPVQHFQEEERKLLRNFAMEDNMDEEEEEKEEVKKKPRGKVASAKKAAIAHLKPVAHAKPSARSLVLKIGNDSGSAGSSTDTSPITSPVPATTPPTALTHTPPTPTPSTPTPSSPIPPNTISTLPQTSPSMMSPPQSNHFSSTRTTSPPSFSPTPSSSSGSFTAPSPTPSPSTPSRITSPPEPAPSSQPHHHTRTPDLLIPKSEPASPPSLRPDYPPRPDYPSPPKPSDPTDDDDDETDIDEDGTPSIEDSSTPFEADVKVEGDHLTNDAIHAHHSLAIENNKDRVKRKYTKRGTGKVALAKAAAKAKAAEAIASALAYNISQLPQHSRLSSSSDVNPTVSNSVASVTPTSSPRPHSSDGGSLHSLHTNSSLTIVPVQNNPDASSLLAIKTEALKMLQQCVSNRLITEEQYKAKQQEFLISVSF